MSLNKLAELNSKTNIELPDEQLKEIGQLVLDEFDLDKRSRSEWESQLDKIMKIAKQTKEIKNTPWENASNVKFPLIANAAIQFAARNYPEIVQSDKVVRFNVLGDDNSGYFTKVANAIEKHMSYQLTIESDEWEKSIDSLLHILPVVGLCYTKEYYNPITMRNCFDICTPDTIIVHNDVKSLESARRINHIIYLHKNDIVSGINKGIYNKNSLDDLDEKETMINGTPDPDGLHKFIEQHRYLDLDEDGYQEPYVVTVNKKTGTVLRIVSRWDMDKIIMEGDKVVTISPVEYFTDWHFIPSPDGKFHSLGFGSLLYPINHTINTLVNQLIDSGTLNNLQSGIVGRGIRIKGGALRPKMGEFIVAEATDGMSLKENIFPFPTKEPSGTLFELLGLMIQTGEKLASITDILSGQQQAQNSPATTILALEEQGLKVSTGIQKRLFRALKSSLSKLFRLNRLYFTGVDYPSITVDGLPLDQNMYILADKFDICPVFDPDMATDIKRAMRAQAILQLASQGLLPNPAAVMKAVDMYLKELRVPENDRQALELPPPPPPPDPDLLKEQTRAQKDYVMAQLKMGDQDIRRQQLGLEGLVRSSEIKQRDADAAVKSQQALHDTQLKKIDAVTKILGTVNPEKGITMEEAKKIIDKLLSE